MLHPPYPPFDDAKENRCQLSLRKKYIGTYGDTLQRVVHTEETPPPGGGTPNFPSPPPSARCILFGSRAETLLLVAAPSGSPWGGAEGGFRLSGYPCLPLRPEAIQWPPERACGAHPHQIVLPRCKDVTQMPLVGCSAIR